MEMDTDKEADGREPPSYTPGTIKKIALQNFMCHDSFELELGPRVNFIIGPNGSGKSALLTAIVVVLGGRASTTSRAKRNSEFVKYGKHTAKITLVIHNYDKIMDKHKAFKPDEYGKKIIIEKIISKDPQQSAKLVMKNDKEKRISERKQELDDLLDFFKIQTNNPICILNQEVSKSFLHSKKPEDKFDLFMKATNLEQIESDYNEAKVLHGEWDDCNMRKQSAFKLLDKERQNCTEKINFITNRMKLQEQSHKIQVELICALLNDQNAELSVIDEKIKDKRESIDKSDVDIRRHQEKIESAKSRIEQHGVKIKFCKEEREKSIKKRDDLSGAERRVIDKICDVKRSIAREQVNLARLEKSRVDLQKSIDQQTNQMTGDTMKENEKRKLEIEQLNREEVELKARMESLRERINQLRRSMTDVKQEVGRAFNKSSDIKRDIAANEANLRSLYASQDGDLRAYGPHAKRIDEEVERAFQAGRFGKRPYGPIGRYIKLRTPDVSPALEIHLGNFARAFVCDTNKDMLALNEVFKSVRAIVGDQSFREPNVFVRAYKDRFDANRYKAHHDVYQTLIDHIEVSESAVYNALLDRTALEQALFVPDYNEAQNMMITPSLIPKGTRMAYTKDRHIVYPRSRDGGFRSIADDRQLNYYFSKCNQDQIARKKEDIDRLKQDLRSAEAEYQRLSDSDKVQRSEYDASTAELRKVMDKLREIEHKLLELRTAIVDVDCQGISVFEDELEKCMAEIHERNKVLAREKSKLEEIEAELAEIKSKKLSNSEVIKVKDEEIDKTNSDISKERELVERHEATIKQITSDVNKFTSEIEELSKKLDDINTEIAKHEAYLRNQTRPTTVRPTEEVRSAKKKVDAALSVVIDENQDPEEQMAALRKRMEEIGELLSLKDHNKKNFQMTAKSLKDREVGFRDLKDKVTRTVTSTFASVMKAMNMTGEMSIYLTDRVVDGRIVNKSKTLEMSIGTVRSTLRAEALNMAENNVSGDQPTRRSIRTQPEPEDGPSRSKRTRPNHMSPSEKENQRMTDTRSLSGGERSFSTVAFVLSLWHHCQSPFKLMDEVDVFMDMVTRRLSYNALIRFAERTEAPGQFIYFSPLELPAIDGSENLVRVFEMPRIIRRGIQSLPPNLQED